MMTIHHLHAARNQFDGMGALPARPFLRGGSRPFRQFLQVSSALIDLFLGIPAAGIKGGFWTNFSFSVNSNTIHLFSDSLDRRAYTAAQRSGFSCIPHVALVLHGRRANVRAE
jgi:hypothetical protein